MFSAGQMAEHIPHDVQLSLTVNFRSSSWTREANRGYARECTRFARNEEGNFRFSQQLTAPAMPTICESAMVSIFSRFIPA
jgi:hypothetical protein